jgi:hypothetical protein
MTSTCECCGEPWNHPWQVICLDCQIRAEAGDIISCVCCGAWHKPRNQEEICGPCDYVFFSDELAGIPDNGYLQ